MTMLGQRRSETIPRGQSPEFDALIKEARRRQRHRYRLMGAALCVVAGAVAVGSGVTGGGGGRSVAKSAHPIAPSARPATAQRPPEGALPSSALFNQISSTPQGLLLSGVTPGSAHRVTQTCAAASVDPHTLYVRAIVTGSCDDPRLSGQSVEAVNAYVPRSNSATISISSVSSATGQVILGPVVMTYGSYSDTHPVMAYGGGWLWIYDVATTFGPELLQVSTRSGAVAHVVSMPKLYKPLLAADDGGVWVANSIEGSPGPALSYVADGASSATTVLPDTGLPICWLTAGGTNAWIGTGVGWNCGKQVVERYVDGGRGPTFSTPGGPGLAPFFVIGDGADGLWAMQWTQPVSPGAASPQRIVSINPATGAESVSAKVPSVVYPVGVPTDGLVQGQGVYFEGALYLLEPPFHDDGYLGYTSIVRVPVDRATPRAPVS